MSSYAVYFDYDNKPYRLPVNPEQIEINFNQANETYEVLKLGQIVVPAYMELREYSFGFELPREVRSYVEKPDEFKKPDYYLYQFGVWRNAKKPVRFIASNGIASDINVLVLIEELTVTEKAGEEGDKYVSLKLKEYREYGKVLAAIDKKSGKIVKAKAANANPKNSGTYAIQAGDSLWSIAKKYYGDGSKCNIIYNANKDKIKNPNLIYPGQKLKIPSSDEFSKYSAALPSTKTSASTKSKSTSLATQKAVVGERPIAGITLLLDSISGRSSGGGGISSSGNTHSGGSRGF